MKPEIKYLEFIITDKNGKSVKNGDDIIIQLPSYETYSYDWNGSGDIEQTFSAKLIKANLRLQLSKGFRLRVLEIIENDDPDGDDLPIKIGDRLTFRYMTWDWWKA